MLAAGIKLIVLLLIACSSSISLAAEMQTPKDLDIEAKIPRSGFDLAFDFGALWMMTDGRLVKVDPTDNTATDIEIPVGENSGSLTAVDSYRGIAVGEGAVWIPDLAASAIYKIDPQKSEVVLTIPTDIFGGDGSIGVGEGSVWVITFESHNKTLTRYDAVDGSEVAKIELPRASNGVLVAYGSVWITATSAAELYRIDPNTNSVIGVSAIHGSSDDLVAGDGSIWIPFETDGTMQRVDGQTGEIIATIPTGVGSAESGGDIATGGGFVWMITRESTVTQIEMASNSARGVFRPATGTLMGRRIRFGAGSLGFPAPPFSEYPCPNRDRLNWGQW
jgi:virginiamycin B lyase